MELSFMYLKGRGGCQKKFSSKLNINIYYVVYHRFDFSLGKPSTKKNTERMVFGKGGAPPPPVWSSFGYFYTDRDMAKIMFYSIQNTFCI